MDKLDVGSGGRKMQGYVSLDKDSKTKPDFVHDIETPWPFPDNHFIEARLYHILEHVRTEKKIFVMRELWRVLRPGGTADIEIPSFPSPQSVQDPDHKSFWHRNSFMYFEHENRFRDALQLKTSEYIPEFKIIESELVNNWLLKIKLRAVK